MTDVAIEMIGVRSGRLLVIERATGPNPKRAYWLCLCDCGNKLVVMGKYLRRGEVKSCGCLNRQGIAGPANYRHGHAPQTGISATYTTWASMVSRCENTNSTTYQKYGAKGITVCERWHSFNAFLADMGNRPKGKTIDRIDGKGNYEPGNCRWATAKEQVANSTRVRIIEFQGVSMNLSDWARKIGIAPSTLCTRLKTQPLDKALTR